MIYLTLVIMIVTSTAITEFYSIDDQYNVYNQTAPQEIAHMTLVKNYFKTGWDQLYIYTQPEATPLQQHRAAGFLEGYSTYREIYAAYLNFKDLDFGGKTYAPESVRHFLNNQLQYMDYMVKNSSEDIFWQYVGYYLQQLRFMHAGYSFRIKKEGKPELSLDFQMLYYLPSIGDLEDLLQFSPEESELRKNCQAYIRLEGNQLYTTHATHNRYPFLLRTYKHWNFPRPNVPLQSTSFTSRPGDFISKDDFFILSTGLRVLETSLENKRQQNLEQVKSTTVPSWLRTIVANHLSTNAKEWINYFLMWRSGTHNNQWLIIDPSKIGQHTDLVVFFQEAFSLFHTIDMTDVLIAQGYVASYNTPISMDIYNKLGYQKPEDPPYDEQLRGKIFAAYHPKMTNIEAMKYWLINNEEQSPKKGLAPRYDLYEPKPKAFGLTDCKISSEDTIKNNYFWAQSGPSRSNGRFPPFDWKKWIDPSTPREGLAQVYEFDWVKIPIDLQLQEEKSM